MSVVFLLLTLLLGGAVVAGYFYLKSDALRIQLERKLSEQTTTPVSIQSLSLSWNGVVLDGVVIPNEAPFQDDFLNTRAFVVEIQWSSLWGEVPAVDALVIRKPVFVLHQGKAGGMQLPLRGSTEGKDQTSVPEGDKGKGGDLLLKRLEIHNASFQVLDARGESLIRLEGMELGGEVRRVGGDWGLNSKLSLRELILGPHLRITDGDLSLEMSEKKLTSSPFGGVFYKGRLEGESMVDMNPEDPVFSFTLNAKDADMDLMMQDFGKPPGFMQGLLQMDVSGRGRVSSPKQLTGSGQFSMKPARMPKLQAAKILGGLLGVQLIRDGTFQQINGTFTLHDEKVDFSRLEVRSENISVVLSGVVTFDKRLDLKGKVILEPGETLAFTQLFGTTADEIRSEKREVPIQIAGSADDPKVRVDAVKTGLDAGKSLLNRFLTPATEATPEEGGGAETAPVESVDGLLNGLFGK